MCAQDQDGIRIQVILPSVMLAESNNEGSGNERDSEFTWKVGMTMVKNK